MACVSHLPHVLANVLVAQAAPAALERERPADAAGGTGPSFRDATRVAGANTAIWTDIYLSNRDALIAAIDEALRRLEQVREMLRRGRRAGARGVERARARAVEPRRRGWRGARLRGVSPAAVALARALVARASPSTTPAVARSAGHASAAAAGADRRRASPERTHEHALRARRPRCTGELTAPPDKSISHRAALLGAMASEPVRIDNYLHAADTTSTLERRARARARSWRCTPQEVVVRGTGLREAREPERPIDVGNAGTLLRLLPGWLAAQEGRSFTLDGDESIRRRPVDRVAEPLRLMGADLEAQRGSLRAAEVHGARLRAISYELPVASAQVKSCVLLAALAAEARRTVGEPAPSRDHTERMLLRAGVAIHRNGRRVTVANADELVLERVRGARRPELGGVLRRRRRARAGLAAADPGRRRQLDAHRLPAHRHADGGDRARRSRGRDG